MSTPLAELLNESSETVIQREQSVLDRIGVFFIASLQLVFLGIMGEYIGAIYTQLQRHPYAVELERLNFDKPFGHPRTEPLALSATP